MNAVVVFARKLLGLLNLPHHVLPDIIILIYHHLGMEKNQIVDSSSLGLILYIICLSSSRVRTSPSETGSEKEQPLDEPSNDAQPPDSNIEVSLSCGVTTDPSLWILPPEEETPPLTDNVFDESTTSAPSTQTSETSVSPSTSVSDADISQQVEAEKDPETEDEKVEDNQEMEERGTPEGETGNMEGPVERPQWEELVEIVVKADQSLTRVLYPLANRKTALMLMEQLLSEDTLLMEEHYKKKQEQKGEAER